MHYNDYQFGSLSLVLNLHIHTGIHTRKHFSTDANLLEKNGHLM